MWRRLRVGLALLIAASMLLVTSLSGCVADDDFALRISEMLETLIHDGDPDELAALVEALAQVTDNPEAAAALPMILARPDTLAAPTVHSPEPFFRDDFYLPGLWYTAQENGFRMAYREGGYRIENRFPYTPVSSVRTLDHANVHLEVSASWIDGPAGSTYGLVCRWQDVHNYYVLMVGGDGRALIGLVADGFLRPLATTDAPENAPSAAPNHTETRRLGATCAGDTLRLSIDGQLLLEAQDGSLSRGYVGLAVANHGEAGMVVHFDDFGLARP
jgi:hypothetical protein